MEAQEKQKKYDATGKLFMGIVNAESNDVTRENANMNADTPSGMMMKFASETTKNFALDYLIDEEIAKAHKEGIIHIHDLDYYVTKSLTCLQHPLDQILKKGFRAGHGSSRPARSIRTASMLACISLETNQNEMHGGQAIPAFDFYMAPYVRMTFEKEVLKAAELFGFENFHDPSSIVVESYDRKSTKGMSAVKRVIQHAINETVD
jgi:ribonucleoside-triphosphate reductase